MILKIIDFSGKHRKHRRFHFDTSMTSMSAIFDVDASQHRGFAFDVPSLPRRRLPWQPRQRAFADHFNPQPLKTVRPPRKANKGCLRFHHKNADADVEMPQTVAWRSRVSVQKFLAYNRNSKFKMKIENRNSRSKLKIDSLALFANGISCISIKF